ncbi:MAG: hypothetical protein M1282_18125 [Chloroflexi bacterium]|nr:hypothetical protein [Chloroflexota bacterium]
MVVEGARKHRTEKHRAFAPKPAARKHEHQKSAQRCRKEHQKLQAHPSHEYSKKE